MHTYLIEMLQCPVCRSPLNWVIIRQKADRIEEAEVWCSSCTANYVVREGIGLFLTPDLPRNDLWAQMDSHLLQHLRDHPELERQLMNVPLETLAPTDQHFRAMVLEERGNFAGARVTEKLANQNLYTPEYTKCWNSQIDFLIDLLAAMDGPVFDLASGRCYLVEQVARRLKRPVVATDFSPSVLRQDRKLLQYLDLYDHVSLLAFDARRTPFKPGAIQILTTNLGLPNIEAPGRLLQELRRVVAGTFLAISHFFPRDDQLNGEIIRQAGLETLLYQDSTLAHFTEAGWQVDLRNTCEGPARPTPASALLEGARADGLPVADTTLTWSVLEATAA